MARIPKFFVSLLLVIASAISASAQYRTCWDCYGAGWCFAGNPEGWQGCGHITIHCPGNPFCSPGENGNYIVCWMTGQYQYCVYGANHQRLPFANVQWRQPGVETNKLIPWITNDNLGADVAEHSVLTGFDQVVKQFQVLELKNGTNAPATMIGFVGDLKQVIELSTNETYDKTGTVHVTQFIRVFQAKANRNAKSEADEGFVRSHDMIIGKAGKMIEELRLDETGWTLTNKNGTFKGKVAPYTPPLTKAQAEKACKAAQKRS